jgi:hypothetical protein
MSCHGMSCHFPTSSWSVILFFVVTLQDVVWREGSSFLGPLKPAFMSVTMLCVLLPVQDVVWHVNSSLLGPLKRFLGRPQAQLRFMSQDLHRTSLVSFALFVLCRCSVGCCVASG